VRNKEGLQTVKQNKNKEGQLNCIGHILRKNCLLKHGIEGKIEGRIEVTGRRGRRRNKLLDDRNEKKGYRKLKEEAPLVDSTLRRIGFGKGYGPAVRQTT
jgi:hypothetical protein